MSGNIRKTLRKALNEVEYNYHYGNVETKDPTPHYSDNVKVMSGRGTGHFGSGMYFSTYTCNEKSDADDKFGEYSDYDLHSSGPKTPQLIQVDNALYRVDLDIYKNLFRVKSDRHGDILFKTLKLINDILYWAKEDIISDKIRKGLSDIYITIEHNLESIGLKAPRYKEFLRILKIAANDITSKEPSSTASMSTRIMEFNGFNGVNVTGINKYDNTTHGSVIYDISKMSSDMKKVKNPDMFCDIKSNVSGNNTDIKTNILRGEEIYSWDKFDVLPDNERLKLMKRYFYYTNTTRMSLSTLRMYYSTLGNKMRNNTVKGNLTMYMVKDLIESGYWNLIFDPNIKINNDTFLAYVLDNGWNLPDDTKMWIIKKLNRELSDVEQEYLEDFKAGL